MESKQLFVGVDYRLQVKQRGSYVGFQVIFVRIITRKKIAKAEWLCLRWIYLQVYSEACVKIDIICQSQSWVDKQWHLIQFGMHC